MNLIRQQGIVSIYKLECIFYMIVKRIRKIIFKIPFTIPWLNIKYLGITSVKHGKHLH